MSLFVLTSFKFHRVKEYVKIKAEEKDDECYPDEGDLDEDDHVADGRHVIPEAWPRSGEIEFRNVTVRYHLDGPNILTDINLKFKAGERVGLVGRTGSGKTTVS
jgi:ABC-type multidrug transport system fused ATPase/permease subunit